MITFREATIEDVAQIIKLMASNEIGNKRENAENLAPYIDAFTEIEENDNNYLMIMCDDPNIIALH